MALQAHGVHLAGVAEPVHLRRLGAVQLLEPLLENHPPSPVVVDHGQFVQQRIGERRRGLHRRGETLRGHLGHILETETEELLRQALNRIGPTRGVGLAQHRRLVVGACHDQLR